MVTQKLVKDYAEFNRDDIGVYDEELARLELEDAERKGCHIEYGPYCLNCPANKEGNCPLNDWQKRHPEYVNDELNRKIKARRGELKNMMQ